MLCDCEPRFAMMCLLCCLQAMATLCSIYNTGVWWWKCCIGGGKYTKNFLGVYWNKVLHEATIQRSLRTGKKCNILQKYSIDRWILNQLSGMALRCRGFSQASRWASWLRRVSESGFTTLQSLYLVAVLTLLRTQKNSYTEVPST